MLKSKSNPKTPVTVKIESKVELKVKKLSSIVIIESKDKNWEIALHKLNKYQKTHGFRLQIIKIQNQITKYRIRIQNTNWMGIF